MYRGWRASIQSTREETRHRKNQATGAWETDKSNLE